jgi:hypothetical protein
MKNELKSNSKIFFLKNIQRQVWLVIAKLQNQ